MKGLQPEILQKINTNKSIGNFEYYEKVNDQEIIIHTSFGRVRVKVYDDKIFRVSPTLNREFEDFNYAVIQEPVKTHIEITENDENIYISTAHTTLEVAKQPVRFCFKDRNGKIINEDESFGTSWIGEQVTTYKKLQKEERFVGLGEKTGHLDRFGNGYQNWNTDYFGYGIHSDPLYMSIPFYIGIHPKGLYGIFLNNSFKTHFNFGASNNRFSSFSADSGLMDYFYFGGDTIAEIIKSYTWLTGRMPMPPKWSIGYQQCRYSYYPDTECITVAKTFRDKDIPADAIVLDIHYMDNYKIFTWDEKRFPDPKKLINSLKEQGFNVIVMCDPGIKVEEDYAPYQDGKEKDIFIKYPDGEYYEGEVWPGWCHFPDFTKKEARDWWQNQMEAYTSLGVNGFWNDMNEIATWGQMLPELIEMDFDGNPASARKGRNVYGMQMARSTYNSTKTNMNKRPFNLTRAGFSGVQRYAAVWTGDNVASDDHMLLGVRLVNSLGLSGVSFTGYDVGGFVGNADEQLFARWLSIGAFAPFFRGHSMINSRDSEPWAYGEEVEEISRNYIKLRYRLLPYIYSLFFESSQTGMPIARSLTLIDPLDNYIYKKDYENQYMFGPNLLIAPVSSKREITKVYLPKGKWYELYNDQVHEGSQEVFTECPVEKLPVFVKAGSIVCMQEAGQNTNHKSEFLEIHIYQGDNPSEFLLYDDDGISLGNENGNTYQRKISFNGNNELRISKTFGNYNPSWKKGKIYFHGYSTKEEYISPMQNKSGSEEYRFVQPISNFDPIGKLRIDKLKIDSLPFMEFDLTNDEITITW